jgi:hypothetical protein
MRSRTLGLMLLSLLIIPNLGCQSWRHTRDCFYYCEPIDEMMLSYNCHRAAKAAWKAREHHHCERKRFDHFGLGFREGYASVAMGGNGCPPPLPHRRYWGWRYQNCEGQECVAAWFDGYPAGARAAEEDGVSNWSRMQTSYLIDAQYASRMSGNKRVGAAPVRGAFPGEELEELVAPVATPNTDGARGVPGVESPIPVETPAPSNPESELAPTTETTEEFGAALRNLDAPPVVRSIIKGEAAPLASESAPEVKVVRRVEAPAEELVAIRKFEMPAVEVLSGLSVPKKQSSTIEAAPEIAVDDSTPIEDLEGAAETTAQNEPAPIAAPSLSPVAAPVVGPVNSRGSSIVAETPAYSLNGENGDSASVDEKVNVAPLPVKRKPPIVPAQSKKKAPPIVRPVERGRVAQQPTSPSTQQVSFESQSDAEAPVLRRIDLTK